MSAASRRKGKRGEADAERLLAERDWKVQRGRPGVPGPDLLAADPLGKLWAVEVKHARVWHWPRWTAQARDQARAHRLPWALLAKIPGTRTWLLLRQGKPPVLWNERRNSHPTDGGATFP